MRRRSSAAGSDMMSFEGGTGRSKQKRAIAAARETYSQMENDLESMKSGRRANKKQTKRGSIL